MGIGRREFIKGSTAVVVGAGLPACSGSDSGPAVPHRHIDLEARLQPCCSIPSPNAASAWPDSPFLMHLSEWAGSA